MDQPLDSQESDMPVVISELLGKAAPTRTNLPNENDLVQSSMTLMITTRPLACFSFKSSLGSR